MGKVRHLPNLIQSQNQRINSRRVKHIECYILTLDRAVNQRCTCVNKRKKKRKLAGVMKEYRLVPVAVELVGDRKVRVRASLQTEQPQPECGRSAAMVNRRSWANIEVCPCHHSCPPHRNINPLENKV